jgi:beta-aspartyl-dipeptidase (metallo-type)
MADAFREIGSLTPSRRAASIIVRMAVPIRSTVHAALASRLTLFRGGKVYAPEPLGVCDILVDDGVILAVEEDIAAKHDLGGAGVVDLHGMVVVPGFVDNHCHVLGGGGADGYQSRVPGLTADEFLAAGITTVIGMLGLDATTRHLEGLLAHVRGLREGGMSAYMLSGATPSHPVPALTTSPAHDMFLVEEVIGAGEVSLSELGYLFDSYGSGSQYVAALASELWLMARLTGKAGIVCLQIPPHGSAALLPLFDIVETTGIPREQFIPSHVNQSPRLPEHAIAWASLGGYVDIGVNYAPARGFEKAVPPADALRQLLDAGAPLDRIMFSTDGGGRIRLADEGGEERGSRIMTPRTLLEQFTALARSGWKLAELAQWFASVPARALRLEHKGHVAPGHDADFLAFTRDCELSRVVSAGRVRLPAEGV